MSGEEILRVGLGNAADQLGQDLDRTLGGDRQQRYKRFLMSALGSIPWIGGVIAAMAAAASEAGQGKINELQKEWLEEHQHRLRELSSTLIEIVERLESMGDEIQRRIESEEYLALVGRAFRTWDQADTEEKRRLIKNLLMNAGGTSLCPDDLVRLFIQWIDTYHEAHFSVIRAVYRNPGATRADIWRSVYEQEVREDSAEADLFKLLVRDLSTGSVIRQHRDTTSDGRFVKKPVARVPKGLSSRVMKSAFDDVEQYELTELGRQFVHYTMNEVVPRLEPDRRES